MEDEKASILVICAPRGMARNEGEFKMPVSFPNFPANWKIPLYYVELDSSKAGLPVNRLPVVLVGLMRKSAIAATGSIQAQAAGTATEDVLVPVASQAQADALFGRGSQLACMFETYFRNNWAQEVYGLPLSDASGTAATKTITVATAPTAAGTVHLYIAGRHVQVSIASTDDEDACATAIAAAVNDDTSLPVTATAALHICTLTAKSKGTYGSDIPVKESWYGAVGGQVMPAGMTLTIADGVSGAGDPDCATAITNLGDTPVEYLCMPYIDANNFGDWTAQFDFGDTGRWGFVRQLYGHIFCAAKDDTAGLQALALTALNSPQLSILGVEETSPTPAYEWAAAYTGKAARALSIDPARPLQSLHLEGCMPAKGQDRFLISQLNTLSESGIATQRTLQDGVPIIARETTVYLTNLYGNTDDAYTDVTTLATLAKLLRNQRQAITSKFPRHKIANDGTRFGPGQAILTPKSIKAELIAQYRIDEFNGLVEDAKSFIDNLIVERDSNDPNRVNVLYPPDLVNAMRIFAVLAQFRLQYNRGVDLAMV